MTTCEKTRTLIDTGVAPHALASDQRRHLDECGACRTYAEETQSLISLLAGTPRVEAPPDFDFRLRARIATVRGQRSSIWTSLGELWSRPLAWSRVAATMAAVALVASTLTLYARRSTAPVSDAVARRVSSSPAQPGASVPLQALVPAPSPAAESAIRNNQVDVAANTNPRPANSFKVSRLPVAGQTAGSPTVGNLTGSLTRELPSNDPGAMQGTRVVVEMRGARPVVTIPQVTYGAQRAVMRQNASAGDVAATQTVF